MASTRRSSIIWRTLWKVAARIGFVVALATVVSHWHVRQGLEGQALTQLASYVEERRVRESEIFQLASDNLETFVTALVDRYREGPSGDPAIQFAYLFETSDDGTMRVRDSAFHRYGITGFIGKHVIVGDELKRRMTLAYDMLARFGPAWRNRFVNLYVMTPENAVLMYWPTEAWAREANDWEIHGKLAIALGQKDGVLVVGDKGRYEGPDLRWSELYFDYGANDWMVSAVRRVSLDGLTSLMIGQDILLHELIDRTLESYRQGTFNVLFRDDGRLIAHPRYMEAIQAQGGTLSIADTGDPVLMRIFEAAKARRDEDVIVRNEKDGQFLAVSRLRGPDWYLVTVFPDALISSQAFKTAWLVLVLGAVALVAEILILYLALRNQVERPLHRLIEATRDLASGRMKSQLPVTADNEIGQLARSFNSMAQEIDSREVALKERSASLSEVNRQLQRELKERHKVEMEVARHREALYRSEKLNALGSLLAGVAHELNNPLSVVIGRSIMLEEKCGDTEHGKTISRIRQAAERCARIVKTFLAMARQQEPVHAPVDIGKVIEASVELVGYAMHGARIEVETDIAPDIPPIMADPDQLGQVFTNLLINAQQTLSDGPPPRRIAITARADKAGKVLVATVADNGPGVPDELQARIFDPFFTTKPAGTGTGIGLSLCFGFIEAHGGKITVETPESGGTVFTITLPITEGQQGDSDGQPTQAQDNTTARILIVDDELEVGNLLSDILQDGGHDCEIAMDGKLALARLAEKDFDLVITDLLMPGLDGPGLYRELRRTQPTVADRVVFVTGNALSPTAKTFLQHAERPVIEKPFVPKEVRDRVSELLDELAA